VIVWGLNSDVTKRPSPSAATIEVSNDGLPQPRRRLAIFALCFGTALTTIDAAISVVALPSIARSLHIANSSAVLIITVYQLVLLTVLLPCSAIGDRIGVKRMYQFGQMLYLVGAILSLFAHNLPFLIAVRAVQAFGAACAVSMLAAMIRHIYPRSHLGRGLGINSIIATSSAAISPAIGGFILSQISWHWLFAVGAPFGLLSLIFGRALPDVAPSHQAIDKVSALFNVATFGLVFSGIDFFIYGVGGKGLGTAVLAAGIVSAFFFVRRERASPRPILPVDLLAEPALAWAAGAYFLGLTASMLLTVSIPFRLEQSYGMTPSAVGAVLVCHSVAMVLLISVGGILADRYNSRLQGVIGMVIIISATLALALIPGRPGVFDLAWRLTIVGLGTAIFLPSNSRQIIGSAPPDRAAAVGGLMGTMRLSGQAMGAILLALLLSSGLGNTNRPMLLSASIAMLALLCCIVMAISKAWAARA
jgi:DHA2 family multidrug resistance protein-like MFS transporter